MSNELNIRPTFSFRFSQGPPLFIARGTSNDISRGDRSRKKKKKKKSPPSYYLARVRVYACARECGKVCDCGWNLLQIIKHKSRNLSRAAELWRADAARDSPMEISSLHLLHSETVNNETRPCVNYAVPRALCVYLDKKETGPRSP